MRAWLLTVLILVILSGALVGLYFGVPSFKEFVQENIFASDSPAEESGPDMPYEPEAQKTPKSDPSTPSPSLVPRPTSIPPSRPAPKITSRQETAIVKKYPYIKFPTLEKAVNNWFGIPSKLFPIQVIIVNGILISIPPDSSMPIPPGGQAFVTLQRGNLVQVRPKPDSPYQKFVSIDETNLKQIVSNLYDTNVKGWHRFVDKQRQDDRDRLLAGMPIEPVRAVPSSSVPQTPSVPPSPTRISPNKAPFDPAFGKRPVVNSKGQVQVAVNSIHRKGLKDCQLKFVQRWGILKKERIKGRPYWTVEISYLVDSIFGRFPQDAKALIRNGRVEKWVVLDN